MKVIILAGGSGSRLWPLSREYYPKYLLSLITDDSLFQSTIKRFMPINNNFIIVTNKNITDNYLYSQLSVFNNLEISVLKEPAARNTAAAIALAVLSDNKLKDEIYLVSPSDHIISKQDDFLKNINEATAVVEKGYIVTFGIKPTKPETGFGYIKHSKEKIIDNIYKVESFKEKPNLKTAKKYFEDGSYFWNSGMFLFKKSTMLEAMQNHCPNILSNVKKYLKLKDNKISENIYSKIENISIDYAVMEKASNIVMALSDIGWDDVGSWKAICDKKPKNDENNSFEGDIISVESSNNYVYSKDRITAIVGLNNTIVVDTKDALLICDKDKSQEVKKIYNNLKERDRQESQYHLVVEKPWGSYFVLEESENFKVKKITVNPNQKLSLQLHNHRNEHWVVVKGTPLVINGEQKLQLKENESTFIPVKSKHRLINETDSIVEIIEVQYGSYLGEDDIVRFEDIYHRI